MALSHNIKPDRGLTTRMLITGFFLVVLYAVLIGVLFIFIKSLIVILVIGFGLLFCQYFFSDKIAMFAMHAKEVTPEQAPELHGGRHAQASRRHRPNRRAERVRHRTES
jgi:heat shock protein HtpX